MMVCISIKVIGKVQGVGFRFTAHRIARRYDLVGFVRNLPNGSVEMLAQGVASDIQNCLDDISENFTGHIRDTKIEDAAADNSLNEFVITF